MAVYIKYLKSIIMLNYATQRRPSWGLSFLYTQDCNTFPSVRESQADRVIISNTNQKPANTLFLSSVSLLFLDVIGLTLYFTSSNVSRNREHGALNQKCELPTQTFPVHYACSTCILLHSTCKPVSSN